MNNLKQIQEHNDLLRECIETAENLPDAGGEVVDPIIVPLNVTENGEYYELGVDGYNPVVVNVPIPDGYIKPSGAKTITTNGVHDVAQYTSVNVNVPTGGGSGEVVSSVNAFLSGTLEEVDCDGIVTVNPYTFYTNAGLQRVRLANAQSVGNYNFADCDALESVDLPNVTDTVGTYFCYSCSNLTSVNLPKVAGLNNYAFQSSAKIEVIDLPNVTSIGNYSFRYCSKLTTVILRKTDAICTLGGSSAFVSTLIASGTGYIYVPKALIETYKTATNWSKYANQFRAIEDYPEICG